MAGNDTAYRVGLEMLREFREGLGGNWDALGEVEQVLVERAFGDAATLHVRAMATPESDADAWQALRREQAQVVAQFANLTEAARLRLVGHAWRAIRATLMKGVALAWAVV